MLVVYDLGEGFGVSLIAHVPGAQRVELVERGSGAGFCHFAQAKIDGIGQEYRE